MHQAPLAIGHLRLPDSFDTHMAGSSKYAVISRRRASFKDLGGTGTALRASPGAVMWWMMSWGYKENLADRLLHDDFDD